MEVVRVVIQDFNEDMTYYFIRDEYFDERIMELQELCENYETYQEVEDFISENFKKFEFYDEVIINL